MKDGHFHTKSALQIFNEWGTTHDEDEMQRYIYQFAIKKSEVTGKIISYEKRIGYTYNQEYLVLKPLSIEYWFNGFKSNTTFMIETKMIKELYKHSTM